SPNGAAPSETGSHAFDGLVAVPVLFIRRALRILSAASVIWAGVVGLSGGFHFEIGILRVSSREGGRPLLVALVAAALLAAVSWTIDGWKGLADEWSWWRGRGRSLSTAARARWPWL